MYYSIVVFICVCSLMYKMDLSIPRVKFEVEEYFEEEFDLDDV